MQFVPGTHLGEVRNHRKQEGLPLVLDPPPTRAVPCRAPSRPAWPPPSTTAARSTAPPPTPGDRDRRAITTIFHGPPVVTVLLERPWLA